jgi:nitrate reductase gamma subunit
MSNSIRWLLFLIGIAVVILAVHFFLVPSWPSYPAMGLRYHHFGPRTFPWGSFTGLLTIFGAGFILYKLLFPSSGSQSTKEGDFCPYCGREFEKSGQATQEAPQAAVQKG